jgi:hypothetical protein
MKITWSAEEISNVYGKEKASKSSSKPFTIPINNDTAKTNSTSKAVTWSVEDIQNVYGKEKKA